MRVLDDKNSSKDSTSIVWPADHKANVAFNSFTPRSLSFNNEMPIAFVSLCSPVPIWWRYNWNDAKNGLKSSRPAHVRFWISEFAFVAICVPSCLCLSSSTRNACLPQPKAALDWIIFKWSMALWPFWHAPTIAANKLTSTRFIRASNKAGKSVEATFSSSSSLK